MSTNIPNDTLRQEDYSGVTDLLGDQLARLFARDVTRGTLAAAERGEFQLALWNELSEIGVVSAMVAEGAGGAGLSWRYAGPLLERLGASLPPVPLGETMLVRWALGAVGLEAPDAPLAIASNLLDVDDHGRAHGEDALVSWVPGAESVLGLARAAEGRRLLLISTSEASVTPQRTLDRLPAARLVFRGAKAQFSAPAPTILGDRGLLAPLAVLRSLQMAGSLAQVLALCIDYANARTQFGKTIGKFQAIQHLLAELAEHAAAAHVASGFAARQFDRGNAEAAERGAAVAKIRAGRAATRGAAIAHQVFGAIGITDEHILHSHTRRLWQWRAEAGSETFWAEWLGGRALAEGGASLWSGIVAGTG
jgi:acyl-CoA dehydrogenase